MKLTALEKATLVVQLDMHLQGMLHAASEMEADTHTLSNMDEFMDVMGRVNEDIKIVETIIRKVKNDISYTWRERASRSVRALSKDVRSYARRVQRTRSPQRTP